MALAVAPATAHDFRLTASQLWLGGDGTFAVEMTADLDALALGLGPGHDPAVVADRLSALPAAELDAARQRVIRLFERRVRVRFDGDAASFQVLLPQEGAGEVTIDSTQLASPPPPQAGTLLDDGSLLSRSHFGVVARLEGKVPDAAVNVTFFASRSFAEVRLEVYWAAATDGVGVRSTTQPTDRGVVQLIERGSVSEPIPIAEPAAPSRLSAWGDFLRLGFRHILPDGFDHLLFIIALFLVATRLGILVAQVTAFTVAHSVTLALATFGVISVPSGPVEILIGLSIAFVAIENLVRKEPGTWRLVGIFVIGLLHGLGFASSLAQTTGGAPRIDELLMFNVGVEIAQVLVVVVLVALTVRWREREWFRGRVVVPASVLLAIAGLYLGLSRITF